MFCAPGAAQTSKEPPQKGEVTRQLETNKDTLKQTEQRMQSLQADVKQLSTDQARINEQLIETGRLTQQSEARLSQIEARVGELDAQEKLLRGSLAARHEKIAKLFAAMQRMGRNPPPVIVTRREDALQMVRSAMLLARAFPELKTQADDLSQRLQDLVRVMNEARTEGEKLRAESSRLTEARTRLATLVESKRRSLSDRQRELEDVRRSAAEIARSVTDLGELIAKLDKTVSQHTALAGYEQELKEREAREAQIAAAQPATSPLPAPPLRPADTTGLPPPGAPPAPVSVGTAESGQPSTTTDASTRKDASTQVAINLPRPQPQRIALEPQGALSSNTGRMRPAIPFHQAKGQLPMPASGKRMLGFGDKNQFGRVSRGLVIETRPGATVVAPSDGWIVYAGEFRSYGQVLIINAGGGYHILLSNLARTDVEVGKFVLAGEPVGAMSSNVAVKTQDSAPVLYVEFRNKEGQSIDPAPWWADGSQKVQG